MEGSPTVPRTAAATVLTRVLCLLILLLMTIAAAYGASMAVRYFPQIGV